MSLYLRVVDTSRELVFDDGRVKLIQVGKYIYRQVYSNATLFTSVISITTAALRLKRVPCILIGA